MGICHKTDKNEGKGNLNLYSTHKFESNIQSKVKESTSKIKSVPKGLNVYKLLIEIR